MGFEDTIDGCNRICPYCGYSYQVECEDYSEDTREEECGECGKKFWAEDIFSIDHKASPDCKLNGQEHTWGHESEKYHHCLVCGKCERKHL